MIRALGEIINRLNSQSPENIESYIPNLPTILKDETELTPRELKLLQEMTKMFGNYHDSEENIQFLRGILSLFSDENNKIMISGSQGGKKKSMFIFDEQKTIKNIIRFVTKLVKAKNNIPMNNLAKYKTVYRDKKSLEQNNKFSVSLDDLQKIRINFAKRKKTKQSTKSTSQNIFNKTRVVGFSLIKRGNIAVYPTIINAVKSGNYILKEKKFKIQKTDFLFPMYERNLTYNIMLVLDTSKSIMWVVQHIEKFLSHIVSQISNSEDKLGLITFNNDLAKIYHYPTANIRQVIGTINKLEPKGSTPLGKGLSLATRVFSKERYRILGVKNIIILISDCFPEPLEGGHKDLLEEPSYKDVISATEKIKREKIELIIINPSIYKSDKNSWNKKLIKKVINISNAKYMEIHPKKSTNIFNKERFEIDRADIIKFTQTVWEIKSDIN